MRNLFQIKIRLIAISFIVLFIIPQIGEAQCQFFIIGPPNNMISNPTLNYTLGGTIPGVPANYTWSFIDQTGTQSGTQNGGLTFAITPPNPSYAYQVTVTYNPPAGGTCTTTFITYSFCDLPNLREYANVNSSQITGFSAGNISNENIIIYGALNIDVTTSFTGCTLNMAEGSSVVVNGQDVAFANSQLLATCQNKMWRGVRILNGGTIKIENTRIDGAQYAINFLDNTSGSEISTNTLFTRNYISIYAPPRALGHSFNWTFLEGFEITGAGILPTPFWGVNPAIALGSRPIKAIELNNSNDFPLGLTNSSLVRTRIHDIPIGIDARNSRIKVNESDFWNISGEGIRILASGQTSIATNYNFEITANNFGNVANSTSSAIRLSNCVGSLNERILIRANVFNDVNSLNTSGNTRTAISVTNKVFAISNVSIINNIINNSNVGISCSNVVNSNTPTNYAEIAGNEINFNQPENEFNIQKRGVYIGSCTGIHVHNNVIKRDLAILSPTNVVQPRSKLYGIDVNSTSEALIEKNHLRNLGTGILFTAINSYTNLFCNTFESSYRGVHLNQATISKQGTYNNPQDNKWINFGNVNRVSKDGVITTLSNWFFRNTSGNQYLLELNNVPLYQSSSITHTPGDNTSFECGIAGNPNLVNGDSLINEIAALALDSLSYLNPYSQSTALQLYEFLSGNTALLDSFPELAAFYGTIDEKFEGQYMTYIKLLQNGEYTSAYSLLQQMNPSTELQYDLMKTIEISRRFLEDENYVLSSRDSSDLIVIANKTVFRSGNAVINAREMLELILEDVLNNYRLSENPLSPNINYNKVGETYFFFDEFEKPIQLIEVFNPLGQLLYSAKTCSYIAGSFPIGSIIRASSANSNKSFRGL
jgi:hypothetical protein